MKEVKTTKEPKVSKPRSAVRLNEWLSLVIAVLFLTAGTLRAIQLEAQRGTFVLYIVGFVLVTLSFNAIYSVVSKLRTK